MIIMTFGSCLSIDVKQKMCRISQLQKITITIIAVWRTKKRRKEALTRVIKQRVRGNRKIMMFTPGTRENEA